MTRVATLTWTLIFALCFAGCGSKRDRIRDYSKIWASEKQANPKIVVFEYKDGENLLNSTDYREQKMLLATPALTPMLMQQMNAKGHGVTLKDLGDILTQPLSSPEKVSVSDVDKSIWMLGVRNVLFGTETDKSVELHLGEDGIEILVLRKGEGQVTAYYEDVDGEIAEYLWDVGHANKKPRQKKND